jgi:hypothetical protein
MPLYASPQARFVGVTWRAVERSVVDRMGRERRGPLRLARFDVAAGRLQPPP